MRGGGGVNQSVCCPAMVMTHEPNEEMTLVMRPSFPYALSGLEVDGSLEHCIVS
jgi:hypothetical protein